MGQVEGTQRNTLDLRLKGAGRAVTMTHRAHVETTTTLASSGLGFSWSQSRFDTQGSGVVEVSSTRNPSYIFTQVVLDGAFEAELACGARYTSDTTGLVRPRVSSARYRATSESIRMFGVLADVACVEGWFGNKVPDPVRRLLDGVGRDTFYRPQPIPAHLKQTLKQALASDTPMRPHLIEASAFHIIGFQLENLAHLEDISITRADYDMAHDAFSLIAASPHSPPTLNNLARDLNIAPNRLDRAFRTAFGRSVYEATVDIRYEAICTALLDGEAIKVVAGLFGYASVSNFSSAFRRKMGAPPRQWLDQQSSRSWPS